MSKDLNRRAILAGGVTLAVAIATSGDEGLLALSVQLDRITRNTIGTR
jgi:hypothetical protein